jgi:ABC-type antimicrobial peptide transport system permease subunit
VTRRAELRSIYGQIARTYVRWAPSLVLLAVVVFIPLGLLHAITLSADIGSLDLEGELQIFALVAAVSALAVTGLLGEVFYTGAVAISLTHPHGDRPPSLREIAGMINYRRLIAIDLIYGVLVAVGFVFFIVPGLLAFVWLGLAAPVVEIEHRGIREAFARSVELVRGKFLVVLAVLVPIEIFGDTITNLLTVLAHDLLGETLLSEWLADVVANVAFTPFYAVAAVLIAVERIREKGGGVELHSKPVQ